MNELLVQLLTALIKDHYVIGVVEVVYDPLENDGQAIESTYNIELETMSVDGVMGFTVEVSLNKLIELGLQSMVYKGKG
jgi:hypothetical protein